MEKMIKERTKRYIAKYPERAPIATKETLETWLKENPNLFMQEAAMKLKIGLSTIRRLASRYELSSDLFDKTFRSLLEKEIYEFIRTILPDSEIITNGRKALENGQELDIYIPSLKLAI
jgi:hypothetical protein